MALPDLVQTSSSFPICKLGQILILAVPAGRALEVLFLLLGVETLRLDFIRLVVLIRKQIRGLGGFPERAVCSEGGFGAELSRVQIVVLEM